VFLVDDGVNGQGGFTHLTVADDQFPLATTDGDHGVNGLVTGLYRLIHRLTVDNAGSDNFHRREGVGIDGAFAVDRFTQSVDHPAQQAAAYRYFQDTAGGLNLHAFGQVRVGTHHHGTHGV